MNISMNPAYWSHSVIHTMEVFSVVFRGWFRKKGCITRQNGAISWAVVWTILESRYGEYLKLRGGTDVGLSENMVYYGLFPMK